MTPKEQQNQYSAILIHGKTEKALTKNIEEQEVYEGKKQTQQGSREKILGCILVLLVLKLH